MEVTIREPPLRVLQHAWISNIGALTIARVRPVRIATMRMMAGRGRPGIPYYECHGDSEGETGEERRQEDDGGEREARNTLL
jgi:hypothetical protein